MSRASLLFPAVLVLWAGCSPNSGVSTYPAEGFVRFPDGKPLAGGWILFESPDGLIARGMIDENGAFRLGTQREGDGAVIGKHRVSISPPEDPNYDPRINPGAKPRKLISDRFTSIESSGIELVVTAKGPNKFDIQVTAPPR